MIQLDLFDSRTIRHAHLVADSPRQAFYKIWLEGCYGKYRIRKESAIKGKVLDRRSWIFPSLDQAEKDYCRRIKGKTNPNRKSPRIYKLDAQNQTMEAQK